ncbi:MAG TPA: hypothetical protein ACFYEL_10825, partial [Candidatus Wunengus californicus]|uniref:hypothetical protein n=1 Tax=Candidatus Wunengus californicus TaxID=3367619 RepID=UPI004029A2B0
IVLTRKYPSPIPSPMLGGCLKVPKINSCIQPVGVIHELPLRIAYAETFLDSSTRGDNKMITWKINNETKKRK